MIQFKIKTKRVLHASEENPNHNRTVFATLLLSRFPTLFLFSNCFDFLFASFLAIFYMLCHCFQKGVTTCVSKQ